METVSNVFADQRRLRVLFAQRFALERLIRSSSIIICRRFMSILRRALAEALSGEPKTKDIAREGEPFVATKPFAER